MHNKSFKVLGCIVFVTGVLSGLAGCSSMPSQLHSEKLIFQLRKKQSHLTLMLLQHKMIRKVRSRKQKEALRQRDRRLEQNLN